MPTETLTPPNTSETEKWVERLIVLRHAFYKNKDKENTRKISELIEKVKDSELMIGFCGHFSAGKSSLINRLIGEELLPSSPIPTTANLAKIKSGNSAFARVYFNEGKALELPYPYDLDDLRGFALDGDAVHSLEISHPIDGFGPAVTMLDTPGIDSTDEAHRAATESALHLADVVFYVTDYNHVQSQLNLAFLKDLNDQGKKTVLIVNQIDKHSPAELNFPDYRREIESTFAEQNIELDKIFYTSLKDEAHPENQINCLRDYVMERIGEKDQLVMGNAESSARHLISAHIQWKAEQEKERREQLEQALDGVSENDRQHFVSGYKNLAKQLQEQQEKPAEFVNTIKTKIKKSLDSAILMPYTTREAARNYIESEQPGFKTGLFFSKKKTEEERRNRLQQFHKSLTETAATVDWKVKELLVKEAEAFGIKDKAFLRSVYDMKVDMNEELLTGLIQTGATLNGNYVLRYSDKITKTVKQLYRAAALEMVTEAQDILKKEAADQALEITTKLAGMKKTITALEQLQHLTHEEENERLSLNGVLSGRINDGDLNAAIAAYPRDKGRPIVEMAKSKAKRLSKSEAKPPAQTTKSQPAIPEKRKSKNFKERMQEAALQLNQAAGRIENIKGVQSAAREMCARAKRLEENQFTIALFGAFSAGKSSFANALIGENVLPVSPNPTTATINRILPVDKQHPHETVCVKLKSEQDMLADVNQALIPFDANMDDIGELPKRLQSFDNDKYSKTATSSLPFLQAVATGLDEMASYFGKESTVNIDTFHDLVANEGKACFVEWIELYYNCPLTREGITLVDTPGADSINARHTNVAFDYIKNADAVLFVTYYNHAFSRADREFLIQLGRVKDSFAMDKMFFVVNAADLASSTSEINTVVRYVEENLLSYGIRQPRIYPLSSQTALIAKRVERDRMSESGQQQLPEQNDGEPLHTAETMLASSGMSRFENEFMRFTVDELTDVAVKSAHHDIERVIRTLNSYISSAQEGEGARHEKRRIVTQTKNKFVDLIENVDPIPEQRALEQKIDKLVYYINQRIFLRFMDAFKEAFNPSVLSKDELNKKRVLQACLDELLQFIGFDLAQEMRATALRVETFTANLLTDLFAKTEENIQREAEDYSFRTYERPSFQTPKFENDLQDVDNSHFNDILGLFKNPKHFFEKDAKKEMRLKLEERIQPSVSDYLSENGERIKNVYCQIFEQETEVMKQLLIEQIEDYTDGQLAALSPNVDIDEITEAKEELAGLQAI